MISLLRVLYGKFHDLILYGIIGTFSAGFDFAIYSILIHYTTMQYLVANCISVFGGISTSFVLNRNYNFKVKDHTSRRFSIFFAVGLCGLILSNIILFLCIDKMSINKTISKVLSIILVALFQFLINKFLTFKPSNNE